LANILRPADGRLYPAGYIPPQTGFIPQKVITKSEVTSADITQLFTIDVNSLSTSLTLLSPNITTRDFVVRNILRKSGCLYPAHYYASKPNYFDSKNIKTQTKLTQPNIRIRYIFLSQNVISENRVESTELFLKYTINIANIESTQKISITDLFTNPVYNAMQNINTKNKVNASTDLYPDWDVPHKKQIGTGVNFNNAKTQQKDNSLINKQASRQDIKNNLLWQIAQIKMHSIYTAWLEKRRVDRATKTPFSMFISLDFSNGFHNLIPKRQDRPFRCIIVKLKNIDMRLLSIAHQPPAQDKIIREFWNSLFCVDARKYIVVPRARITDRPHFVIMWGVGGLGCKKRYIPALGNAVVFELEQLKTGLVVAI
jgi:hypothetical protein